MQPNILTRRGYKGKNYVKNAGQNLCRIRNIWTVGPEFEKIMPNQQHFGTDPDPWVRTSD
jgi:hypothetical protein